MTKNIIALNEDACLLLGIQKGDQQSLNKLYDKYAPALMGIIYKLVQEEKIAEEILQKTFQLAWQQPVTSQILNSPVFTWLLRLARSAASSSIKLQQQNPVANDLVYGLANGNAVAKFSVTRQNTIFDLLYYKGLGYEAVASLLKIPVEEVKRHFSATLKNIDIVKVL
jgi:DNA-directed RNA polymerase specialized sigma24 family protein